MICFKYQYDNLIFETKMSNIISINYLTSELFFLDSKLKLIDIILKIIERG